MQRGRGQIIWPRGNTGHKDREQHEELEIMTEKTSTAAAVNRLTETSTLICYRLESSRPCSNVEYSMRSLITANRATPSDFWHTWWIQNLLLQSELSKSQYRYCSCSAKTKIFCNIWIYFYTKRRSSILPEFSKLTSQSEYSTATTTARFLLASTTIPRSSNWYTRIWLGTFLGAPISLQTKRYRLQPSKGLNDMPMASRIVTGRDSATKQRQIHVIGSRRT